MEQHASHFVVFVRCGLGVMAAILRVCLLSSPLSAADARARPVTDVAFVATVFRSVAGSCGYDQKSCGLVVAHYVRSC